MIRGHHHASRLLARAATAVQRTRLGHRTERLATLPLPAPAQPLTASWVPSSASFEQAISRALAASAHDGSVSLLVICVDYFDVVTASHGRDVAKEILTVAASRITDAVRLDDAMAQHGDDGYAILWAPRPGGPDASEIASRIANQFNQPIMTSAGQLPITVSIGVSTVSDASCAETDPHSLARQARSAVLSAQRAGRSQLAFFDRAIQEQAIESYQTERHLRAALRNNHLDVAYQPIISLHSGMTVGVEALARWDDATLGSIGPATFIPIAEESGLIGELGRQVLTSAIAQGSSWHHGAQPDSLVTVNLSNRQLLDPELIPMISQLLDDHRLEPRQLCLEISESVVMSDVAASMTILGHMKDLGLCLAIDDFGTGYSSLSYLRKLPVDIIKIDQSFVQSIYSRDDRVITKAIIDLAHTLGMTTVAEGVETRLQIEVLHALNCDMAQGFCLHAPVPAEAVDFSRIDFEAPSVIENHDLLSAPAMTMDPSVPQ